MRRCICVSIKTISQVEITDGWTAEEVRDASRVVPLAMVFTLILNGVAGFVAAVTLAYCLGPLNLALEQPYGFAFIGTFYHATQSQAGATVMSCMHHNDPPLLYLKVVLICCPRHNHLYDPLQRHHKRCDWVTTDVRLC
jgi:hypothetical protein